VYKLFLTCSPCELEDFASTEATEDSTELFISITIITNACREGERGRAARARAVSKHRLREILKRGICNVCVRNRARHRERLSKGWGHRYR
jgi:hypothetical protein